MGMSKQDFIALADTLRPLFHADPTGVQCRGDVDGQLLLDRLATFCANQNPRFNRELWFGYLRGECGPSGGEIKRDPREGQPDKSYNGWKNYETWNVALWLGNDEPMYRLASKAHSYDAARQAIRLQLGTTKTDDGVSFADPTLDLDALDELIKELRGDA